MGLFQGAQRTMPKLLRVWTGQLPLGQAAKAHNNAARNTPTIKLWSNISNYDYVCVFRPPMGVGGSL
jgi:hypothetical protein